MGHFWSILGGLIAGVLGQISFLHASWIALSALPPIPPTVALFLVLAQLSIGIFFYQRGFFRRLFFCLGQFFIAVVLGQGIAQYAKAERLQALLAPVHFGQTREVEVTIDRPIVRQRGLTGERFRYEAKVHSTPEEGYPQRLRLYESQEEQPLRLGHRYRLQVTLNPIHGLQNPHGFDYEQWMIAQGLGAVGTIRARLEAFGQDNLPIINAQDFLYRRVLRDGFADSQNRPESLPSSLAVLGLGMQSQLPSEQWAILRNSGVVHLFSVSGLHVTFLALILGTLSGWLWRGSGRFFPRLLYQISAPTMTRIIALILAWSYGAISGLSVPTQRTLWMMSLFTLLQSLGWKIHWREIAGLMLLFFLLSDPFVLIAPGFWLSLIGVITLMSVSDYFHAPSSPPMFSSMTRLLIDNAKRTLHHMIVLQTVMTLTLLPFLIGFFHNLPSATFVANLIAVPWVSVVLMPLSILAVIAPYPLLIEFIGINEKGFFLTMEWLNQWAPNLSTPAPDLWSLVFAACGLVWLLMPGGVPLRWFAVVLMLPMIVGIHQPSIPQGHVRITMIDVGAGLSVLVRTHQHRLLFDSGAHQPSFSATTSAVLPFLQGEGINRLNVLVLSHQDNDHAGGLPALQKALTIDQFIVGESPKTWSPEWQKLPPQSCHTLPPWVWDGVRFEFLSPKRLFENSSVMDAYPNRSGNHSSCVLKITTLEGGQSMLLTADLEREGLIALTHQYGIALQSTVLQLPHHGSDSSAVADFFSAAMPRHALISGGVGQRGYPAPKMHVQLQGLPNPPRYWHTWFDGAIDIQLSTTTQVHAYRQSAPHWAQSFILPPYRHRQQD